MKTTGYIETSDHGRIFYTEEGSGQPIIFIHGWSSTGENSYGHLAAELSGEARCIYFDLREHGKSSGPNACFIKKHVEDLYDLIHSLDLHDVILVGHSLGGLIIYGYFEKYNGERISGVSILDMSPKVLCSNEWKHGLRTAEDPSVSFMEHCMQNAAAEWMSISGWMLKAAANMFSAVSPFPYGPVLYGLWLDMLDADYRSGAQKISVPLTYFYSDCGMYPASVGQWLKNNLKTKVEAVQVYPYNHFTMLGDVSDIVPAVEHLF